MLMLIRMVLNVEHHSGFRKKKGWINYIDPYGWFQWYIKYWLGRRALDDERQIASRKVIVSRFKDKLIKMIKDANGRFDNFSISPKIRQISFHLCYELVENNLLCLFFVHVKMSYY